MNPKVVYLLAKSLLVRILALKFRINMKLEKK